MTGVQTCALPIYTIQGKMFSYDIEITDELQSGMNQQQIKEELIKGLLQELKESKYIEFTKIFNPVDMTHKFHARIYAVPDNKVRLIRLNRK